jgi:signal transduction histidine kinase
VRDSKTQGETGAAEKESAAATEHRVKRLLLNATSAHRRLAMRQAMISTSLGTLTMLALYCVERAAPTIDNNLLNTWGIAIIAITILRVALHYLVFRPLASEVAKSTALRLIPLIIILIISAQWGFCVYLFVGKTLTFHVFVLFAGLLGASVAMMGMLPSVPIAAIVYLATIWPPFFWRLYQAGWTSVFVLIMLAIGIVLVLWACVFLQINQVQSILNRSDKVDLLLTQLQRANAGLQEANAALDAMRCEAAAELESRSMFFSSASHDFRQRLHAMKLVAHSAINDAGAEQKVVASLLRLADSVEDVEHYVTDVLDFARIDGRAMCPDKRPVELQKLFQQLELNFEDVARANRISLFLRATNVVVLADASMLQRILENLLSNAIKFSAGRVLVAARRRSGSIAIEVWDQGPGIPSEHHKAIFTPFHQSTASSKAGEGVGLGLAVVKRFADCMSYQILVRSQMGRGSVLTVLIPASDVKQLESGGNE